MNIEGRDSISLDTPTLREVQFKMAPFAWVVSSWERQLNHRIQGILSPAGAALLPAFSCVVNQDSGQPSMP